MAEPQPSKLAMPVRSRSPAPPAPGTSGRWAECFVRAVTLDDYRVVAGNGLVLQRSAWRKMLLSHLCHLSHLSPESPDRPVCSRARRGNESNGVPFGQDGSCLLYTSPSPRDGLLSRMPSS